MPISVSNQVLQTLREVDQEPVHRFRLFQVAEMPCLLDDLVARAGYGVGDFLVISRQGGVVGGADDHRRDADGAVGGKPVAVVFVNAILGADSGGDLLRRESGDVGRSCRRAGRRRRCAATG